MNASDPRPDEYRLDVGGAVIALRCDPPAFADGLAHWFGRPSATAPAHLQLDLELVTHADEPELPRSLVTTKRLGPDGAFDIADGLITGAYDPATRRGRVRIKQVLARGPLVRILEQLFYQAFWSAREAAGIDGFLIHSSAVVADGRGYLFVGHSGAGKSTVARLSAGRHVLGDEMHLVRREADGWHVEGTPFNGLFRTKRPGRAPLAGLLLLKQAPHHAVVAADLLAAVPAIAAEIAPPVGLEGAAGPATLPGMMDRALRLAGDLADRSALKSLEFLPDDGFWPCIETAFGAAPPPGGNES